MGQKYDPDAAIDANESIPDDSPPKEGLPNLGKEVEHEEKKKGSKKDGVDKAMDILDEYFEGVPPRNERFQHDDDHS